MDRLGDGKDRHYVAQNHYFLRPRVQASSTRPVACGKLLVEVACPFRRSAVSFAYYYHYNTARKQKVLGDANILLDTI